MAVLTLDGEGVSSENVFPICRTSRRLKSMGGGGGGESPLESWTSTLSKSSSQREAPSMNEMNAGSNSVQIEEQMAAGWGRPLAEPWTNVSEPPQKISVRRNNPNPIRKIANNSPVASYI